MTGIILSGGKNTRMGCNKAFLRIGGERLIDRTVRIFRDIFPEVILITNEPLFYLEQNVTIVTDLVKNKGPLMGVYTGLFYASSDYIFIAACDMPSLNGPFIQYMIDHAAGEDIVVPASPGGLEPLHAVYSKKCMGPIHRLLDADRLKITGFYKGLKQKVIGQDILQSFDPAGRMFFNVNFQEDLQKINFS
jgi:molybdopterin-guanine dinucleotide biosynthesis protein A